MLPKCGPRIVQASTNYTIFTFISGFFEEDLEVVAADDSEVSNGFIPTNNAESGKPGFNLLTPEDLAREEESEALVAVRIKKDSISDEYDDVVVIEAGDNDDEPRTLDIPRDHSGKDNPGFKLPLPDEEYEDEYADVVVISREEEGGRNLDQNSREPKRIDTKPILPNCFAEKDPGSCLNSHKAWHYDATQNQCQFFIYSGCGGNTNR